MLSKLALRICLPTLYKPEKVSIKQEYLVVIVVSGMVVSLTVKQFADKSKFWAWKIQVRGRIARIMSPVKSSNKKPSTPLSSVNRHSPCYPKHMRSNSSEIYSSSIFKIWNISNIQNHKNRITTIHTPITSFYHVDTLLYLFYSFFRNNRTIVLCFQMT